MPEGSEEHGQPDGARPAGGSAEAGDAEGEGSVSAYSEGEPEGETMKVWMSESGEYDQRGVDCVAVSPEAVVDYLKSQYTQYPGKWGPLERNITKFMDGTTKDNGGFIIKVERLAFTMTEIELVGAEKEITDGPTIGEVMRDSLGDAG